MSFQTSKHTNLQKRLGYQFKDWHLLDTALTHSSHAAKHDNQRMEFLGDRVLGLAISTYLYRNYTSAQEGDLAPRFNHLVRKETCAEIADSLQLGDEMRLGRSESRSGGRRKTAILGDVMEAVIAAIYLDGGYKAAEAFILDAWKDALEEMPEETIDNKTKLQEYVQGKGQEPPRYEILGRAGPDHAPEFEVAVCLDTGETASGKGGSRRKAEQAAAGEMLAMLEVE